jgi:hypothetical protein
VSTCHTSQLVTTSKRCLLYEYKVFNSLPNWIADLVKNKKTFIGKLKSVLMEQSFYLVNNFPDYCGTLWEIESMVNAPYVVIYCYSWCPNNTS